MLSLIIITHRFPRGMTAEMTERPWSYMRYKPVKMMNWTIPLHPLHPEKKFESLLVEHALGPVSHLLIKASIHGVECVTSGRTMSLLRYRRRATAIILVSWKSNMSNLVFHFISFHFLHLMYSTMHAAANGAFQPWNEHSSPTSALPWSLPCKGCW